MICKNCNNEIKETDSFCSFCRADVNVDKLAHRSSNLVSEQSIIKHLEIAGMLEKRIYELNGLINNITDNINNLLDKRKVYKGDYNPIFFPSLLWVFPISWIIISLFLISKNEENPIIAMLLLYYSAVDSMFEAAKIAGILTLIVIAVYAVLALLYNIKEFINYRNRVEISDKEYQSNLVKVSVLEEEKEDLISKRSQAKQYLERVYDENILFPKYRNMVAVLTIHEYFLSGRCEELKGHEGAYNIYENELRQNIIINSLECIMQSLEQIKQNQYMLYQAIRETQSSINSLSYEFSNISSTVSSLETNSKVSAYNSKIAADNTKILSYIELAKY